MQKFTYKEARNRYKRLFWPVMAFYIVAVFSGAFLIGNYEEPPLWLSVITALIVSVPVVCVPFLMVRYFREADEFVRLQHLTAFAYGACFIVGAIFVAGFLQMFDAVGHIEVFWFGPAFFFAYGIVYKLMGGKDCA